MWTTTRSPNGDLELYGSERYCSRGTGGSFTIQNIRWGKQGYVQELDATFEYRCPDAAAVARGEVHVKNPQGPAELTIGAKIAADGTFDPAGASVTVRGSVSCNAAAPIFVRGSVEQSGQAISRADYPTRVECTPGAEVAWSVTLRHDPMTSAPFRAGEATVKTHAAAWDEFYGNSAFGYAEGVVRLS